MLSLKQSFPRRHRAIGQETADRLSMRAGGDRQVRGRPSIRAFWALFSGRAGASKKASSVPPRLRIARMAEKTGRVDAMPALPTGPRPPDGRRSGRAIIAQVPPPQAPWEAQPRRNASRIVHRCSNPPQHDLKMYLRLRPREDATNGDFLTYFNFNCGGPRPDLPTIRPQRELGAAGRGRIIASCLVNDPRPTNGRPKHPAS
jgi:hypothetical protein